MAVTNAQILDFLLANPNMSDADIASAMAQYGISPTQMAAATGIPTNQILSRLDAVGMFAPTNQASRVVPTARGTVIEGDNIEGQIAGIPQAPVGTAPASTAAQAPVTSQEIVNFLQANPNLSDAAIVKAMAENGVSPAQLATAVGLPVGEVISRVALTVPQGSSVTLGDTRISPSYQVTGSGEDQQIGNLDTIIVEKTNGDINYKAPVGSTYQQYGADGTFQRTGVTQEVNATKDFLKFAAGAGLLFGGGAILDALGNVVSGGSIRNRATVVQQKTRRPVQFELMADCRKSLLAWLERRGGSLDDFVFPSRVNRAGHLSTRQYARLVDEWVSAVGLNTREFGTHSLRRTKASLIYKATGNLRAVQILLGHSKIENTIRYLGVDIDDALTLAERTEI
jgi:hypothetical protein